MPNVDVERKLWNTINNIAKAANSGTVDLTGYAKTADVNNADVERKLWNTINNKVERSDLTNYATKSYVTDEIAKAGTGGNVDLTGYAKKTDLNAHTSNTNIHITTAERNKWNDKLDNTDLTNYATKTYVTDEIAKASTSGTVDLTGYAKTADVNSALNTKVDKVTGKSLVSDTEIARLKNVDNYDDSSIKTSITNINSQLNTKANKSELFSKSYNDLTDKPTIPSLDGYATKTYVTDEINKASLSGGTVDLSDYAKTADVNASLSNKVNKSGDTMTGTLSIKKSGDDANLLTFDTDRPWYFKQGGTGADSSLDLISSNNDKNFRVLNPDKTKGLDVRITSTKTEVKIDGNKVYHAGDKPKLSELTNDAGFITSAVVNTSLSNKVDKVDGKGLSTNDYTTEEKTKVGKIVTNGNGTTFLANDGTYKKVSSSASSAVAERKFKPVFGFDTYWGEMRDNHGNKNQVDLATIKQQIDECESMKVDRIICTIHIGWDETTNSLVIAENTDSILSAISYCNGKNVTIDTAKVHVHFKGTSKSEKDYVNDVIGMSTFQTKYKAMLTTICNLFKNTTVTRIIILNEMWYITNAKYGYSSFVNECLNIVKSAGYTTGLSMAGFNSNLELPDAVIQNIDTFYINVYPGISGFGGYITKSEAIEAFKQCDVDLWIEKTKKKYPDKKIVISEMGTDDYWENLAAPSSWQVSGTSKTGGHAVDTYITAMMEFFINKNVEIEELWWWYNLYYEPVKETLLNYLGGRYFRKNDSSDNIYDGRNFGD